MHAALKDNDAVCSNNYSYCTTEIECIYGTTATTQSICHYANIQCCHFIEVVYIPTCTSSLTLYLEIPRPQRIVVSSLPPFQIIEAKTCTLHQ